MEECLRLTFGELRRIAGHVEFIVNLALGLKGIELLYIAVERLIRGDAIIILEEREGVHRHELHLYRAVLHLSSERTLVLLVGHVLVGHHHTIVLLRVYLTTLTHLASLVLAPAWLNAQMLVHLSLQDTEFIHFGLGGHAQTAVSLCTIRQASPEVGELTDYGAVVTDGRLQVSRAVMQKGTIEDGKIILRLHMDDIIEVGNSPVVVTQLHTQLSTVIMCQEVIGIKVYSTVIIFHSTSQVVVIVSRQGTVDIVGHNLGLEVDGLAQELVSVLPLLAGKGYKRSRGPCVAVKGVYLQTLVQPLGGRHSVLLLQTYLRIERISIGEARPLAYDGVKVIMGLGILLEIHLAEGSVEPIVTLVGIEADGMSVIVNGFLVFILTHVGNGTQIVQPVDVGIEFEGLGHVILSTAIVLKVELGDATILPGAIEVRFENDNLIEILYGEHVVLIVQGYLSTKHKPVGIILGNGLARNKKDNEEHYRRCNPRLHAHTGVRDCSLRVIL